MEERIAIEPGSFFESVPAWADCYILSHVIHDWSEEQNLTILGHCRKVMKPESKLLIVEFVLPSDNSPHPGKILDMVMLTVTGGEERTEEEYGALLASEGGTAHDPGGANCVRREHCGGGCGLTAGDDRRGVNPRNVNVSGLLPRRR